MAEEIVLCNIIQSFCRVFRFLNNIFDTIWFRVLREITALILSVAGKIINNEVWSHSFELIFPFVKRLGSAGLTASYGPSPSAWELP